MISLEKNPESTPIELVARGEFDEWIEKQPERIQVSVKRKRFTGNANRFVEIVDEEGQLVRVIAGIGLRASHTSIGNLPLLLPPGSYHLENPPADSTYELYLGWGLGSYRFVDYKKITEHEERVLHVDKDLAAVKHEIDAITICRDLINTPTSDMLPQHLEAATRKVATAHDAELSVTIDKDLLKRGFRTIYTVGKASTSEPRLIDLTWGDENHPKVTLVGKGVCFDSGGLNIKTVAGMRLMKKDMGGAAHALALAELIMRRNLPVRLRLLIPAVENAIAGNAFRPGDVIKTYKGLTVEIGNTDAEGRLILCDALALACEDEPDLIVDFATLTGAARTAVGTEIAAMFTNSDEVAYGLQNAGNEIDDHIWRMPLHPGYRQGLRSRVADLCNIATFSEGGAITAALYLQAFVETTPWVHYDIMAYNNQPRPAHPVGGEAMGLRATYRYLEKRFES